MYTTVHTNRNPSTNGDQSCFRLWTPMGRKGRTHPGLNQKTTMQSRRRSNRMTSPENAAWRSSRRRARAPGRKMSRLPKRPKRVGPSQLLIRTIPQGTKIHSSPLQVQGKIGPFRRSSNSLPRRRRSSKHWPLQPAGKHSRVWPSPR